MKKFIKGLSLSLIALMAASCGVTPGDSTQEQSSETPSETPSAIPSSGPTSADNPSTSAAGQAYGIIVVNGNGITATADKTTAYVGETVTLNVVISEGYIRDSITVNGQAISGNTFIMPEGGAYVVTSAHVVQQGGIMVGGEIQTTLTLNAETGVYEAKNVKINKSSHGVFKVEGTELDFLNINRYKCFGNISSTGTNAKKGFVVDGGATYDFYYDPSDAETPCYIKRVAVDNLPSDSKTLETLFSGEIGSETCVFPDDVSKVEYKSSTRDVHYTWEKYENSSLASVKDYHDEDTLTRYVYKDIDSGIYSLVDTYLENEMLTKANEKGFERDWSIDREVESKAYSGKYEVVNSITPGHKKYQILAKDAEFDATSYSHNMASIENDIMYSYRTGFSNDIGDEKYSSNIKISSEANSDGSFKTTIKSWVTVVYQSEGQLNYHIDYDVTIDFTKAGALKSVNYTHNYYNSSFFNGEIYQTPTEFQKPTTKKVMTCEYTYGAAKEGKPVFDSSKYFVQSIDDVTICGSAGDAGKLNKGDALDIKSATDTNSKAYISVAYSPATALDFWQYGVVSTNDRSVINYKNNNASSYPFDFVANGNGTTTICISNHLANTTVKKDVVVTVAAAEAGMYKSFWVYTVYPYNEPNFSTANAGNILAGQKFESKLMATLFNNQWDYYPECTPVSDSELLNVTYDQTTGYITFDASPARGVVTEDKVTVTITIGAEYWVDDKGNPWPTSTIQMTIFPASHLLDENDVVGQTYNDVYNNENFNAKIEFKDEPSIKGNGKLGVLSVRDEDGDTYGVRFAYNFDATKQALTGTIIGVTKNGSTFGVGGGELVFDIDPSTGYIGVCCCPLVSESYEADPEGDYTSSQTYLALIGSFETTDDEDFPETVYYFEDFRKA